MLLDEIRGADQCDVNRGTIPLSTSKRCKLQISRWTGKGVYQQCLQFSALEHPKSPPQAVPGDPLSVWCGWIGGRVNTWCQNSFVFTFYFYSPSCQSPFSHTHSFCHISPFLFFSHDHPILSRTIR